MTIEMEDVAEGLAKLISLYGITKLVMGAAADQHYSKYSSFHFFAKKDLLLFMPTSISTVD